jgi:hypothetical protein
MASTMIRIALWVGLLLAAGCGSSDETPGVSGSGGGVPDASPDGSSGAGGSSAAGGHGGTAGAGGATGGSAGTAGAGGSGAAGGSAGAAGSGTAHVGVPLPDHVKGHLAEGATMAVYEHKGYVYLGTGALVRAYPVKPDLDWKSTPVAEIYARSLVLDLTVDNDVLYVAARSSVLIVDIANPLQPVLLGTWAKSSSYPGNTEFNAIRVVGSRAYVSGSALGLLILDVTNKSNPTELGVWKPPVSQTYAQAVDAFGDYAYLGVTDKKIHVLNVSNPASISKTGEFTATSTISDIVAASDQQLFAAEYHCGLYALNVSNKSAPSEVGFIGNHDSQANDAINASQLVLKGSSAYLSVRYQGFDIIDTSDPAHMTVVGQGTGYEGYNEGIAVADQMTFVTASTYGMAIYDTKTPTAPSMTGDLAVVGEVFGLHLRSGYLYLAVRNGGLWVADVSNTSSPRIASFLKVSGRYYSVASQGDYLYLTGAWGGLNVFKLTDPANPSLVVEDWGEGSTQTSGTNLLVDGNTLYYASDSKFNQVNITDPTHPAAAKELPLVVWGIAAQQDYLYVTTSDSLHVIQRSSFTDVNQIAGSFLYAPLAIIGNTLVVGGSNTIAAYDITNPAAPTLGKALTYPGQWSPAGIAAEGSRVWATGNRFKAFDAPTPAALSEASSMAFESDTGDLEVGASELMVSGVDTGIYILEKL